MRKANISLLSVPVLFFLVTSFAACSMVEIKQKPFPALQVQAERPVKEEKPSLVKLTDSSIEIKEKVMFETGSAEILAESHTLLNEVAALLKDNPQIEIIDIEGHTDSVGSARKNKRLSQERAASVVLYLAGAGVDGERMVPRGHGADDPIADNGTEEGRDQNRRVEFNIVKQGGEETPAEDEQ